MYPNLNAEISRKGLKKKDLAKTLNIFDTTLYRKLKGEIPITIKECKFIRNEHFPQFTIEYLFAEEGEEVAVKSRGHYQHT